MDHSLNFVLLAGRMSKRSRPNEQEPHITPGDNLQLNSTEDQARAINVQTGKHWVAKGCPIEKITLSVINVRNIMFSVKYGIACNIIPTHLKG